MLLDDLTEGSKSLVRGRGRALGNKLGDLAREHAQATSSDLTAALAKASRDDRPALGLLLARVTLEEAVKNDSQRTFDRFVFRFAAHLQTSASASGLGQGQRLSLATASELLFEASPTSSEVQRSQAATIRSRFSSVLATTQDWQSVIGISESDFREIVQLVSRELGPRQHTRKSSYKKSQPKAPDTIPTRFTLRPPPEWLAPGFLGQGDRLVIATANWEITPETSTGADIEYAWSAFKAGHYSLARQALALTVSGLSEGRGPTSSADNVRAWNWIRLTQELSSAVSGSADDSRRSWTSAAMLVKRCIPDQVELMDRTLTQAIGDFITSDPASRRALGAYSARLAVEFGHELALDSFTNSEKALLRDIWGEQFSLNSEDIKSTATATAAIAQLYKTANQRLYANARNDASKARTMREVAHVFRNFLDESEGELFQEGLEIIAEAERALELGDEIRAESKDLIADLISMHLAIATSGSLLLQDGIAPLLSSTLERVEKAFKSLGDSSRPEITLKLASSKLPFSATRGLRIEIPFVATNTGNAIAQNVSLRVREPHLNVDATGSLDTLGPGAQSEIKIVIQALGESPRVLNLDCKLQWSDALSQQFEASQVIPAEDQIPVSWTNDDENPFSLGTISEPERLVGRAKDLASLDALIAGRASAYITGHKRVGKTSLTRVLLKGLTEDRNWAANVLPLGRALGQDQAASDLVYALLDEVYDAAKTAYGRSMDNILEVSPEDAGNFARVANKWLRSVARALPQEARVVIAVDDFDELPPHLIEGPQADALFLFLRSLIDEPWLNLIVVGSEILPTIIQAQAHKLNQVVPVSVTNFTSRDATAELLETPTQNQLEWQTEAVDRVHYICAGNPYYETLIAQRVWQTLRDRSRSVVTPGDIEEAEVAVARESSESHYVHLWADSATGLKHTSRPAIVSSAVIRAVARCGGEGLSPAHIDEVVRVAQGWIQSATSDELKRAASELLARTVLRPGPSQDTLLIAVPLVGVWLNAGGARALDGIYAASKHATATTRMVTDSDLVALSRNLRYRGEHVTEIRVRAWLEQFGDHYRQYLAYKMLRRMVFDGYFTTTKLETTVVPRLTTAVGDLSAYRAIVREANNHNLKNAYLIEHGTSGDSTQGAISSFAKALKVKKANIFRAEALVEKVRHPEQGLVLFLLDDYCGSGAHLKAELDQLLQILSELGPRWTENTRIVVGAGIVADAGLLPTSSDADVPVETVSGVVLGERFRPLAVDSGIFDNDKERSDAEEMLRSIGSALMRNNPLGFGGQSLLVLLEFNCPNNASPVFWRSGLVSGRTWTPLFERAI